ncbi:YdeI/OmpD-associated family protein [Paenibacillus sp. LHD-117]|uniref:YdeI/OmpD-associated family protein n=1 Tax=Paenibacillus sp. LHD-117 TaxID=3071412 RepID=UPI0027E0F652|nr:YdeI/OmpD-associated family protein [Paenibacillus sp. LHD-117]MDQ6418586.1 YdeI/OmpD-associated family protein [Paenibacillus sp. LHD-117]
MNEDLIRKLHLSEGARAIVLNPPEGYEALRELGLPESASESADAELEAGSYDYVHLFVWSMAELMETAAIAVRAVKPDGLLWISYPKGTSKVKTDINRDSGWRFLKTLGVEGVASVSMNETWSAMRYRPEGAATSRPSRSNRQGQPASDGSVFYTVGAPVPDMPDDLAAALQSSPAAVDFYGTLTDSMKRDYLRWVLDAKREDTRAKRVASTVEKLEQGLKRPTDKS